MNVDRGYNVRIPLLLGISGLLFIQTAGALSFQDFVQCVGASGQGAVCQLDPGIYPVSETIGIVDVEAAFGRMGRGEVLRSVVVI